jgi:hypothetical protein
MISRQSKSNLHGGDAKEWWRSGRGKDIKTVADQLQMTCRQITPYQIRVADQVDFYPTNGRVHLLKQNKRIDFHTYNDVLRILERIRDGDNT